MTDFSKVYILAEDVRQQLFIIRYLSNAGLRAHAIDRHPLPDAAGGSGEHWVRKHYASAVQKYRRRAAKVKTALIVAIDADKESVAFRARQLQELLNQEPRKAGEAIVYLIPKRNIETWILHLHGTKVNEIDDYKPQVNDDMVRPAAETFHQWTSQPPTDGLPSIGTAIQETQRLG